MRFSNIAFDLDGTLYPNFRLYVRLIPFLLKDQRLLRAMGKARDELRNTQAYDGDFYKTQARLMGKHLEIPVEAIMEQTERLIYRGWEPHFKKIALFSHVIKTLDAFAKAGIKLGLLSDFPAEKKLENLGIKNYWQVVLCSEEVGRLKPDPASFLELAHKMEAEPEQILYVGNSLPYDVEGANKAGMKTALIRRSRKKLSDQLNAKPDFVFHDYRQLRDYVLG